mgnify:CR=1 FL=1
MESLLRHRMRIIQALDAIYVVQKQEVQAEDYLLEKKLFFII